MDICWGPMLDCAAPVKFIAPTLGVLGVPVRSVPPMYAPSRLPRVLPAPPTLVVERAASRWLRGWATLTSIYHEENGGGVSESPPDDAPNTDRIAHLLVVEDEVGLADKLVCVARVFERDEAEALGAAGLTVDHDCAVDDLAVLREERAHRVRRRRVRQAPNEIACVAEVLFTRNRALRVDLCVRAPPPKS